MAAKKSTQSGAGTVSLLDNDLYKFTMQCAVLKYFPGVQVSYILNNRTPAKRFTRAAFIWLQVQIGKLSGLALTDEEQRFLKTICTYLDENYIEYLQHFRFDPSSQVSVIFIADEDTGKSSDQGSVQLTVRGSWHSSILYEVPLLALISEAYFRCVDTDWTHDGQEENAYRKGLRLLRFGCHFSDFGTRRRRDQRTHEMVDRGLLRAQQTGAEKGLPGSFSGTSNVHLARVLGLEPRGTLAQEWFMAIAALTGEYKHSTTIALSLWHQCFGDELWKIPPTDTFGTPLFLRSFENTTQSLNLLDVGLPIQVPVTLPKNDMKTLAQLYPGVRQDSGDPGKWVGCMRDFYKSTKVIERKTLVFSDSLDVDLCLKYKTLAEDTGFDAAFGIGTSLTNDFTSMSTGERSTPLNVVLKLSTVNGKPAIKLTDQAGKHTGDPGVIAKAKQELGYAESDWVGDNESMRWGRESSHAGSIRV